MFRFARKPSLGNHSQYLAKITHLVQSGYVELVQDVISVMAAYCDLYHALCDGIQYTLTQCTVHKPHRSQYTAITLTNILYELYVSTLNQVCNFS